MKLSLIVAMDRNGLIGKDGGLPWGRIPEDMRLFRELTLHKAVIMGRKTWESLGEWLPMRVNVVLSSTLKTPPPSTLLRKTPAGAIGASQIGGYSPAVVIGGAQVYAAFRDLVAEAHVTLVDGEYTGDTYFPFPLLDSPDWKPLAEPRTLSPGVVYHHLGRA